MISSYKLLDQTQKKDNQIEIIQNTDVNMKRLQSKFFQQLNENVGSQKLKHRKIQKSPKHYQEKKCHSFKNVNKRYFTALLEFLINKYSNEGLDLSNQVSKDENNISGNNRISFIDIFLQLKQSERLQNYSLKHYRALILPLSDFLLQQMNEQDISLHQQIYKKYFQNQQFKLINRIKSKMYILVQEHINSLIDKNLYDREQNSLVQSDCYSRSSESQCQTPTCNLLNKNGDVNKRQGKFDSFQHIKRLESGISRMMKGIYVTRF